MTLKKLATFEKYTIDFKLRQFRDLTNTKKIIFIPFESESGLKILKRMRERGYTTPPMIFHKKKWIIDQSEY
jgi:hypothetical protein